MAKREYYNPNPYRIILVNEFGQRVVVQGYKRVVLDDSFKVPPKTLKLIDKDIQPQLSKRVVNKLSIINKDKQKAKSIANKPVPHIVSKSSARPAPSINTQKSKIKSKLALLSRGSRQQTVGKTIANSAAASSNFRSFIAKNKVTVSNNIGIGILSYNRLSCIKKLLTSIRKHTNLDKVTVFVSDESSNPEVKKWLKDQNDIVLIDNDKRLGIAGNSNRLLKCLSRFKYCFLLNDDVEIKSDKWLSFYIGAHKQTGIHHFCFRQYGLIGASQSEGTISKVGSIRIQSIDKKPHGAALFFTNEAFEKVGYFDEGWGPYGMEHVDWSNRVGLSGLQNRGFFDIVGSNDHLSITNAPCSTTKGNFNKLKTEYDTIKNDRSRIWIDHSEDIILPSVSYVIPIRDIGRTDSVSTVINNIRAQKFPVIDIVLVEEDMKNRLSSKVLLPLRHIHANSPDMHFNKSRAFNVGVLKATYDKVILHDADILVQDGYTGNMFNLLNEYDAVHIGKDVMYLSKNYTDSVNNSGEVSASGDCINQVGYFEGGSLGCNKSTYYKVGGFNESFIGYGIEDCDFFHRLKLLSNQFYNIRSEVFYHLHHGRTPGWQQCHETNKALFKKFKAMPIESYVLLLRNKLIGVGYNA